MEILNSLIYDCIKFDSFFFFLTHEVGRSSLTEIMAHIEKRSSSPLKNYFCSNKIQ